MATQSRHRLRLQVDLSTPDTPEDVFTETLPTVWRKTDLQVEFAVYHGSDLLSVANFASVTFTVRPLTTDGTSPDTAVSALFSGTVLAADLDDSFLSVDWTDGTREHGVIAVPAAETDVPAGPAWFLLQATTTDSTPRTLVLGAGPLTILEAGL